MMELKQKKGEKELTEQHHTGTPPEGNKIKHTHTHTFVRLQDIKKWKIYKHDVRGQTKMAGPDTLTQQFSVPVVQLFLTKRVVDVHNISCKEDGDPQSNKHGAFLLKYQRFLATV